jgi:hypothetical protein
VHPVRSSPASSGGGRWLHNPRMGFPQPTYFGRWTSTPDELARFIPAEIEKWAQVVKDAGITPE